MTRNKTNLFRLAAAACLTMGAMNGADKISYEEFPYALRNLTHRSIKIQTSDGKSHKGRSLVVEPDHIRLFHADRQWEDIPRGEILKLEIGQGGRFFHHISDSAQVPLALGQLFCFGLEGPAPKKCAIPMTVIFSPVWSYTAATAPFFLASDGIAFLIPPKVYEITH